MSRIGKMPIALPKGVSVTVQGSTVEVKGPKGTLTQAIPDRVDVQVEGEVVTVKRKSDSRQDRAYHGLVRALVANMVTGVSTGFTKELEIVGVGYRAEMKDAQTIGFSMGHSHPVEYHLPAGIQAEIEGRGTKIKLTGVDKAVLGQVAANIRAIRPPEPYKGKGIKLADERIRRKVGKTGAA